MKYINIKTIFVVFIMIAVTWDSILYYSPAESGAPDKNGFTSGDWYIEYGDHIVRKNETLIVNGSLIINSSGILELSNVTLKINSNSDYRYKIWIKPGGTLYLLSTSIEAYEQNYPYEFIVEGYLYMKECTIENVWGTANDPKSGVQIYSKSVIADSQINGSSGSGIYINESTPIIYNTTISNCYYGIYYVGPLPSLPVSPSKVNILVNRTIQFNASGYNTTYTWESSNTNVGTINSTGVFTSNSTGGCIITATDNNNYIGKAEICVIPDPYTDMKLSPTYAVLNINENLTFNITNGTQPYNWSVDNSTFGTIDQNGTFFTNSLGRCIVQVTDKNNITLSALINIQYPINIYKKHLLMDNIYINNEIGIVLNNSSPEIYDTKFIQNKIGLKLINSSTYIYSCEFTNSQTFDIEMDNNSSPNIYFTIYNWSLISAPDSDNDSMPNYFELHFGFNLSYNDSNNDSDLDGLTNLVEFKYGTDPLNADSDSDGMNDSVEIKIWGTDPLKSEEKLIFNENLTIYNNQTFILTNSVIIFNSTSNNTYGIYVEEGGCLYLNSVEIDSYDENYSYEFVVEGFMYMDNSTISNGNGNSSEPGGIQLYSDSVILDSEINNSSGAGIYTNESHPMISNNTISNSYYGIYIAGPLPILSVSPQQVNITPNQNVQFSASGGTSPYSWESSNTTVGTINSNSGLFTSSNEGYCTIKVTDNNGDIGKATVYVISDSGSGVKVSPVYARFCPNDPDFIYTASGGEEPYEWSVDNESIGIIDPEGLFIAQAEGSCIITATDSMMNTGNSTVLIQSPSNESNITHNMLSDNEYGIYFNNSSPYIVENEFSSNNNSMILANSDPKIESCQIENSSTYDLEVDSNSIPMIQYTEYNYSLISADDSDSDGMPDWYEIQYGLNPNDANDNTSDPDNDNFTNLEEFQFGTNCISSDTDLDGLSDETEIEDLNTNPLQGDTDNDGLSDYQEIQSDIYWFEAEYNKNTNGIKINDKVAFNPDGETKNAVKSSQTSGEMIEVSLNDLMPGKYLYYIKARLADGAPTDLRLKYNDGTEYSKTITIHDNYYKWYKYDSIVELAQTDVYLFAEDVFYTSRIYVDKGVFVKISNDPLEVTTTDDADDTITFGSGGGDITVNLHIPIEGNVRRFVTKASMNIRGVPTETGKGLGSDTNVAGDNNEWNNMPDIAIVKEDTDIRRHIVYQRRVDTWDEGPQTWTTTKRVEYQTSTNGITWSQQKYLDDGTAYYGTPAIDAYDTNVHVAFAKLESTKEIYCRRNLDNGMSSKWKTIKTMYDETDSYEPNLDVDGNNVHVVWNSDNSDIYYSKSMTNGESWGIINEEITEDGMDPMQNTSIAVSSNNIHIIYDNLDIVKYTKLCNNGNTIIDDTALPEEIISNEGSPNVADIAVNGKNIHVVWVDYRDDESRECGEIYYKRSTDNGRTWDSDTKLSNSSTNSTEPCVAVDGKHSLVYVFWSEYVDDDYEIHYVRSDDDGTSWGQITEFTDGPYDSRRPKVTSDENGEFHVVYYNDFDGPELGPPPTKLHDYVYYNYIENDIPTIPDLDVGDDDTIDYEPGIYESVFPIYDFSKEINEYINNNEGEISGGYIDVPLTFSSTGEGTIQLLDINIELGPDMSDPNDPDTDNDRNPDAGEISEGTGLFNPEYEFEPFESSPSILQYTEKVGSNYQTVTYYVIGKKGESHGLYCYDYSETEIWKSLKGSNVVGSPAIADINNDRNLEIIVGTVEGKVFVLNAMTGRKEKMYDTSKIEPKYPRMQPITAPFYSSPAIADIKPNIESDERGGDEYLEIIMVNNIGRIYCLDHNCRVIWIDDPIEPKSTIKWKETTPASPTGSNTPGTRKNHAMATIYDTDKVVLFSGNDLTTKCSDTWIYDLSAKTWTKKSPTSNPSGRHLHALATIWGTKKVVLFGGQDSTLTLLSDTWVYNLTTNNWINKNPNIVGGTLSARSDHGMASIYGTDKVLLFGGTSNTDKKDFDDTWVYDLSDNKWTKMTSSTKPSVRIINAMATIWNTNKISLFGGRYYSASPRKTYGDTWEFDSDINKWTNLKIYPKSKPSDRAWTPMASIWNDDKVFIFGGNDGSKNLNDNWVYDDSNKWWTLSEPAPSSKIPSSRSSHDMVGFYNTNKVVLHGGAQTPITAKSDTWVGEVFYRDPYNMATFSSPVIGDIDNDNFLEIIICDENGKVYCLDQSGNHEWIDSSGFPKPYDIGTAIKSTPGIADIDRDGHLEIIVGSDDGKIYCLSYNKKKGVICEWSFNTYSPVRSSPSIANVDVSTEELEIIIGSDNGITYCLNHDGTLNWQFPAVGEGAKGAFKTTPVAVDLNSYPDGGYEAVAMSEDGHIYCLDTVGAVDNIDWADDYYSDSTSADHPTYRASLAVVDINEDKEVDIIFGPNTYNREDDTDYDCYPNAIKWGMFGAGTKHDGNGDNRFAILIEGTGTGASNQFERDQYKYHIQEMGLLLTEHPGNTKPGPGYTGYYLQDHIYYVGDHNVFPYLDRDKAISKDNVYWAIQEVARKCDSYDKVMLFYTGYGDKITSGGKTTYYFDADNSNSIVATNDLKPDKSTGFVPIADDGLDMFLDIIECKDMIIILQPSYSGDWITPLKQDVISTITYSEKNRVILTSCKSGEDAVFDKCNKDLTGLNDIWYVSYWVASPSTGYESYATSDPSRTAKYTIQDYANSVHDYVYEIDKDKDGDKDFYENYNDLGAEFVSGLTEAFYIDRDYYYSSNHHEPNGYLDADDDDAHNDPEITQGNQNKYVSCKETYYFMLNWHLAYRLNKSPWDEDPDKEFTYLEEGTVYLF